MAKAKRYNRRREDVQWNMSTSWMDRMMSVFKVFIYVMPIVSCAIAMLVVDGNPSLANDWMMTAVFCLALQLLTQLPDAK